MTGTPERREYRLAFSHVDRGFHFEKVLVLSHHPAESLFHLTLRLLAYLLLWQENLQFGTGIFPGEEPDLVETDLTGRVRTFIAVGAVDPRRLRKVVQHNRDATAHVVFSAPEERDAFMREVESWGGRRPRGWENLHLWTIDHALVESLAAHQDLRQRWTASLSGDQFYIDHDGKHAEGGVTRA